MSDKHEHDHDEHGGHGHEDEGGHEIDRMPNARLFNLLFGLSALTLLSCIGVIQLFNMQVEAIEHQRADQGSFRVHEYLDEMGKAKAGWGKVEIKELDDKNTTTVRFYMPLASAKKAVLEDPKLLGALPPPQGWKTADDRAPAPTPGAAPPGAAPTPGPQRGGAQAPGGPVPTPQPVPTDGAVKPPDQPPPTDKPAGDKPTGDNPGGPAPKGDGGGATEPDRGKPGGADAAPPEPAKPKPAKPAKPKPAKPVAPPPDAPPTPDGTP